MIRKLSASPKNPDGCGSSARPMAATAPYVIHQDVEIYDALLGAGDGVRHALASGRKGWVQIVRGAVDVNGTVAGAGDGLAIQDETLLTINSRADGSEILVFDLP